MSNNYPSGTVTFLFTDIEGSTKLAREHGENWEALCAQHHSILRETIESNRGYVFQIIGDAFCAAFHTAKDGLNAAIEAQRALQASEVSPLGGASEVLPLRVRMGIHTGEATEHKGEYRGYLTLSMIQRVMSAGHGGQILLSGASEILVRGQLPANVSLRDMGEHKLKDVPQPARIFQVVAPDLQSEFPALRALDVFPNNLPAQLTNFIGREKETKEIKAAIAAHRLVTLTGSGGTGKTRLSLQVAADLLDQYSDGVWFAELAPLTDSNLIPQSILSALQANEQEGKTALQTLIERLRDKKTLLILDNCEHLIEASAKIAETLLAHAPALRILASSREALGIPGELAWRVPSMTLPDARKISEVEELLQSEAARLFVERAALAQPHFRLTKDNAPHVAQICARLDGIPLALELAAARVKALSVEQVAARLDDRFRLLTGGSRAALPRQQTLRALIDWSYHLLSEDERLLFRRLAVFVGGWTLDAAESVCGEERSGFDILDLMTRLVDKSLVNVEHRAGESRYRRLETIRQYAREALLNSEETAAFRNRHLEYFLTYAETAKVKLGGREQEAWLAQLETEHDNLRAALEWSLETKPEFGLRIAAALIDFWDTRGYLNEGRRWLDKTLQATASLAPDPTRVDVLLGAMAFAIRQSELDVSRKILAEGLELARAIDYKKGIARGLTAQGIVAEFFDGDLTGAEALYNEALTFYREAGDRLAIGQALGPIASCALKRYDFARSENLYSESLRLFREVENEREIAGALGNLAEAALAQRNYPQAQNFAAESLALYQALADKHGVATALRSSSIARHNRGDLAQARVENEQSAAIFRELGDRGCLLLALAALARQLHHLGELPQASDTIREARTFLNEVGQEMISTGVFDVYGRIALAQGDLEQARGQFADGLRFQQNIKDAHFVPSLLEGMAYVMITSAEDRDAVKLLGAASALREDKGLPLMQVERAEYDQALAALKSKVDDASLQNLWYEGFAMSIEEATQFALEKSK